MLGHLTVYLQAETVGSTGGGAELKEHGGFGHWAELAGSLDNYEMLIDAAYSLPQSPEADNEEETGLSISKSSTITVCPVQEGELHGMDQDRLLILKPSSMYINQPKYGILVIAPSRLSL